MMPNFFSQDILGSRKNSVFGQSNISKRRKSFQPAKRLLSGVKPMTAAEALEGIDVRAVVHDLLKNGSRPVKLQTLTVLWDRVYGKPKQEMSVSGGMIHTHTRNPLLASLPKEALEELARKYDEVLA